MSTSGVALCCYASGVVSSAACANQVMEVPGGVALIGSLFWPIHVFFAVVGWFCGE